MTALSNVADSMTAATAVMAEAQREILRLRAENAALTTILTEIVCAGSSGDVVKRARLYLKAAAILANPLCVAPQ